MSVKTKESVNEKLDRILKNEEELKKRVEKIENEETKISEEEKKEFQSEKSIEKLEKDEIDELKKLEELEKEVKSSVIPHPLTKVTYRDAVKGTIGAFIGIVSHFSFLEGIDHSHHITFFRSTLIFIVSFLIGLLFIYYSGFRKVKQVRVLSFIPLRVTLIFFVAITVVICVYLLFGVIGPETSFVEAYKMVAVTSILAMIGAGTADLIGEH